jgi:LysR family transcriptional regulator (chromosome initiation inhibitor)
MGKLDYRGLAVLDAVCASGSFEKAALALGISQSAVSQRVKALEDSTGRLLVVRGTPSVATGLGQRLVVHYRHVQLMEASLDIDLGRKESMPQLALAVDADSLSSWFAHALPPLLSPPRCQLQLQLADPEQALKLVREGAVFACVAASAGGSPETANGTTSLLLGVMRHLCVATPVFAGHWFGDGFSAEAARLAPAVMNEERLLARFIARGLDLKGPFPHHVLPVSGALDNCIFSGVAYGLMPELQALRHIASGQLVDLMPGQTEDVALYWHSWNIDTPFTRALTEQVVETARKTLLQP